MTAVYVKAVSIVNGAGKHAQKRVAEAHRMAKEQLLKDKIVSVISHLLGTVTQNLAQVNVSILHKNTIESVFGKIVDNVDAHFS